MERNSKLAKCEKELITMLADMNEHMADLCAKDLMSEHAYEVLGIDQKKQVDQIKGIIRGIQQILGSDYYNTRVAPQNTSLRKKRISEKQKREYARTNPEAVHICPCCDSIFLTKFNLQRHRRTTLKCSVIKAGKKGALEVNTHRAPNQISDYIASHMEDADSDDEVQEQIEEDMVADLLSENVNQS